MNATSNYWGDLSGPAVQKQVTDEEGNITYVWEGTGEKIKGLVDYTDYVGSQYLQAAKIEESTGVNVATGNYSRVETDLSYSCLNGAVEFVRIFNLQKTGETSIFSGGWNLSFACKAQEDNIKNEDGKKDPIIVVQLPDGSEDSFLMSNGYRSLSTRNQLYHTAGGEYILVTPERMQYKYNRQGYLYEIADEYGNTMTITVNDAGAPTKVTDYVGRITTITYSGDKISAITDPAGRTVEYCYNRYGQLETVIGLNGKITKYVYGAKVDDAPIAIYENGICIEKITYEFKNNIPRVETIVDGNGNKTTYFYDAKNGETVITNGDGTKIKQYYDKLYNIVGVIDGCGDTNSYSYYLDENNEAKYGELRMQKDELGCLTMYEWEDGNITKIMYSNGGEECYQYDDDNHCIYYKDRAGVVTRYVYSQGLLLKEIVELDSAVSYPNGEASKFAITFYTYYDKGECACNVRGLVKSVTTPEGVVTTFTYDRYGNRTSVTNAMDDTVTYSYDILGRVISQKTALGYETTYCYDEAGNLTETILHEGETRKTVYNPQGFPVKEISAENGEDAAYLYEYDIAGNMTKATDPLGNTTKYEYDAFGNVVVEMLPTGGSYHYTYDAKQRIKTVTRKEAVGEEELLLKNYEYIRSVGALQIRETVYLNDKSNYTVCSYYDSEGHLIEKINPDGGSLTYDYYVDGLLKEETDALVQTTYYEYDALKNCVAVWSPCENGSYTYHGYVYDRDGKLLEEHQGVETVANGKLPENIIKIVYDYDKAGRVHSVTDGNGTVTVYEYDADGRCVREETALSEEQTMLIKYTYGHLNKPKATSVFAEKESLSGVTGNGLLELKTIFEYDADGRLVSEAAPDGTKTEYAYDPAGNCQRVTVTGKSGESKEMLRCYDSFGNVCYERDAEGNVTNYQYDAFGKLEKVIDAEGGITLYSYDRAGNRTVEVTPANYVVGASIEEMSRTVYTYREFGRLSEKKERLVDGDGTQSDVSYQYYEYDRNGSLTLERSAYGDTKYRYTAGGRLEQVQTPEAADAGERYSVRYTYDALGRVVTEETALGGVTSYTYDAADNVCSITRGDAITAYEYDGAGNVLSVRTENGQLISNTYNSLGLLLRSYTTGIEGMDSYEEICLYDRAGRLVHMDTSTGERKKKEYDCFGNVTKQSVSKTDGTDYRAEKYTYDKNGNVLTYTNQEGAVTTYTYDGLNRVISKSITVSGKEQTCRTRYDRNGNVVEETDGFGNKTTYTYDPFDRLLTVTAPDGTVQATYTYNGAGDCDSMTDASGYRTTYYYSNGGRTVTARDAEGDTSIQEYDALGNLARTEDGEGNETTYLYDGFGQLLTVTAADNTQTGYAYDSRGNLTKQTDGAGNVISYCYNARNLLLQKTEGETVTAAYTYNGDGSVKTMTDAEGNTTVYTYSVHGEVIEEAVTGADGEESSYSYTYDRAGRLLSMTDESGITVYTYDELGRILTKEVPGFAKVAYTYDLRSGMEEGWHYVLQTDGAGTTRTVYDARNRVAKVTTQSTKGETETAEFSYYDNGSKRCVTYGDGSVEEYTYYKNNLVKSVTNRLPDGTVYDRFTYIYDDAGNLKEKTEIVGGVMRGTTVYGYDAQNRLVTVTEPDKTKTTYTYDGAGNRATETIVTDGVEAVNTYAYNGRNQLFSVEQKVEGVTTTKSVYTYDANGNRLKETQTVYGVATESGKDETTTVLSNTYDLRNQLVRSVTEDTVINNTYNAAGYRVERAVTKDGETTKIHFLYDGGSVIMESDENGTVTAKNTYGGPLLFRTVFGDDSAVAYQYLYNAHGDVVTLLSDGEVAATYYYDVFGNILEQTGDVDGSILYAGYQYDEETGLYYLNARMYDPVTARFLQADTYLGSLDDPLSLNRYTYCLNNPHRYIDPSGHFAVAALLSAVAARVLIGLATGVVSAGMEAFSQKVLEKRSRIDYDLVLYEGITGGILGAVFANGAGVGKAVARQAGKLTVKKAVRTVGRELAIGALGGVVSETGRQVIMGTKRKDLNYGQIAAAGALGGAFGGAGTAASMGFEALKETRLVRSTLDGVNEVLGKGRRTVREAFAKLTGKNGENAGLEALTGLDEPKGKLDLQFFAGDESGSKTIKDVEAPILPEGSSWERNVLNSFAGGKSNSVTYEGGTILYRVGGKNGGFWSLDQPPTTEYQWRVDTAIKQEFCNDATTLYKMTIPERATLSGLEGKVGSQGMGLYGGAHQVYIDYKAVPLDWIEITPMQWK